ncbi:glycosyltransferase family 4 protein [Maribacter dokdonensis]|uniref:glycosyltransferase family 4 protein n=1 Tax=Maribacter dokdonensis TaxID=320912 RepID=UPI002AB11AEE|nr:glycosyltransferase family 4 protein [Maribacter dokdonensis]
MNKKILQISNDFADQKIYINLVKSLSKKGFKQVVYVPVKKQNKIDGNRDDSVDNVDYCFSFILKTNILFRLRYYKKIKLILNDIESKIDLDKIDIVHSHFLFSDGGVAYLLKKKYGIPYVVSVRASDIFTFFNKMLHLRKFGNEIMKEASQVIFINHSYINIFKKKYLCKGFEDVLQKITIIPNAIDQKWLTSKPVFIEISNTIKLLYVGRIIKRKKLDVVIKAVNRLNEREQGLNVTLDVVGNGDFLNKVKELANENIIFHGSITSHEKLMKVYSKCHVFVMPSIKETFGLVYIEALSQGLPIIYCENEGVDGFFQDVKVGYSVRANSIEDVCDRVLDVRQNYQKLSKNARQSSMNFNWNEITEKYITAYSNA